MKNKILHLAIFLLVSVSASANHLTSTLSIRSAENEWMTVIFDGMLYSNAGSDFRMENITPGEHQLKVMTSERWGWNRNRFTRVVYDACILTNPGEEIFATVDCFNRVSISRVVKYLPPAPPCQETYYQSRYRCNTLPAPGAYFPISSENFCALKQSIIHCNFESSRLELAKMAMVNNYFTAAQVAEIMNLFWFESTRLEFAKAAYARTVDSQNYYRVNDSFRFSSSTTDLNQCLKINR